MAAERRLAAVDHDAAEIMERVIAAGDLGRLSSADRVAYYAATCRSLGLNPLTRPFDYLVLNGKTVLYATKGAADQLRAQRGISVRVVGQTTEADVLVVTVEGSDETGRVDAEIGAVSVGGLRGEALANARMKALTKAKRRLTLSMCGLGMSDESEVDDMPGAVRVRVDPATGEIAPAAPPRRAARPLPAPEPEPAPAAPPSRPARPVNLRPLHAAVDRAARNGGDGMDADDVHRFAHDWAAARFGVGSLSDLVPAQLNALLAEARDADAEWVATTWAEAHGGGGQAEMGGMPEAEDEGEVGEDRWTE